MRAPDLAGNGFRQFFHEFDLPRIFIRRRLLLAKLLNLAGRLVRGRKSLGQDDEGLHDLAPRDLRLPDNSAHPFAGPEERGSYASVHLNLKSAAATCCCAVEDVRFLLYWVHDADPTKRHQIPGIRPARSIAHEAISADVIVYLNVSGSSVSSSSPPISACGYIRNATLCCEPGNTRSWAVL